MTSAAKADHLEPLNRSAEALRHPKAQSADSSQAGAPSSQGTEGELDSEGSRAGAPAPHERTSATRLWSAAAVVVIVGLTAGGIYYRSALLRSSLLNSSLFSSFRRAKPLTDQDTIVLADFENKTGDAVFDDTLKTALSVSLNQSPFLNVLSDSKVAKTLKMMTKAPDTKLTPEVARELCQRAGSKAYIAGSVASLGSQYVVGLKVVNCHNGDALAEEQATANGKENVLETLGQIISKLRAELGESLASVQKLDVPLAATTASLDALKAYSMGEKVEEEKGDAAALPYDLHAIELDPNFAMGYLVTGEKYSALGETERGNEYLTKAFQLRAHASESEKFDIATDYYESVTGELDKAAQIYEEWIAAYPRSGRALSGLGLVYRARGEWEKAREESWELLRIWPETAIGRDNLADQLVALQQFDEARQVYQQMKARKQESLGLHGHLYAMDFLRSDAGGMAEEQQWFAGKPEENYGLSMASDTEAFAGHLVKARQLTKRSVDSAIRADSKESGAIWLENEALREAAFGNTIYAKQTADSGLKLVSTSQAVEIEAALADAMTGDAARAKALVQDLNKRYPLDRQVQSLWLPAIHAQLELNRKDPAAAIASLQPALPPMEYGAISFAVSDSCLYHTYIRGEAYLAAGEGKEAAAEFQKIIDHSGIVWNCWTGALAKLGVARANAMEAKYSSGADADAARVRALAAYKDFLTLWKDADPDIPIYKQAKAEYAKLQ